MHIWHGVREVHLENRYDASIWEPRLPRDVEDFFF